MGDGFGRLREARPARETRSGRPRIWSARDLSLGRLARETRSGGVIFDTGGSSGDQIGSARDIQLGRAVREVGSVEPRICSDRGLRLVDLVGSSPPTRKSIWSLGHLKGTYNLKTFLATARSTGWPIAPGVKVRQVL